MLKSKHIPATYGQRPRVIELTGFVHALMIIMVLLMCYLWFIVRHQERMLTEIYEVRMGWEKPNIWNANFEKRTWLVENPKNEAIGPIERGKNARKKRVRKYRKN